MNVAQIHTGGRVRTRIDTVRTPIIAEPKHLAHRCSAPGAIEKPMKNTEDAWWVEHDDGTKAPYFYFELEDAEE